MVRDGTRKKNTKLYITFKHVGGGELATEWVEACDTEMRSWTRKNNIQLNDSMAEVMHIIMFCAQPHKCQYTPHPDWRQPYPSCFSSEEHWGSAG